MSAIKHPHPTTNAVDLHHPDFPATKLSPPLPIQRSILWTRWNNRSMQEGLSRISETRIRCSGRLQGSLCPPMEGKIVLEHGREHPGVLPHRGGLRDHLPRRWTAEQGHIVRSRKV